MLNLHMRGPLRNRLPTRGAPFQSPQNRVCLLVPWNAAGLPRSSELGMVVRDGFPGQVCSLLLPLGNPSHPHIAYPGPVSVCRHRLRRVEVWKASFWQWFTLQNAGRAAFKFMSFAFICLTAFDFL